MGPVHIGVGHQDDFVVSQVGNLEFIRADTGAQRLDEDPQLLVAQDFIEAGFLNVQDLALQGQNGLIGAIAALFGGTTGGVALYKVDLRERWIFFLAIGKLAR